MKRNSKKNVLLIGTFFWVIMLLNLKVYAATPQSTLKVESNGVTVTPNSTLSLIDGFTKTWKIKSSYGWNVYSPDAGIIKVNINRDRNNSKTGITISALSSNNRLNPGSNPGYTYITISEPSTKTSKTFFVQVKPHVTTIYLSASTTTIISGEKLKLSAMTRPMNFVGVSGHGKITWGSDNTSIATVEQNGMVSFNQAGKVKITVMYSDGKHPNVSTSLNFTVGSPTSKLSIKENKTQNKIQNNSKLDIFEGISKTFNVNSYKGWDISSPDLGIINLNWNHKTNLFSFTGINPGTTYIDIIEKYTGVRQRMTVCVLPYVTDIEFTNVWDTTDSKRNPNVNAVNTVKTVGSTFSLNTKITPSYKFNGYGYGTVYYSSNDNSIAKVDSNGVVKFYKTGVVSITATYSDGIHRKPTCTTTFNVFSNVESVSLENTSVILGVREAFKNKASIYPKDKVVVDKSIFTSRNENIARVNQAGVITAVGKGITYIDFKVVSEGKEFKKSCKVEVRNAPSKVILNANQVSMVKGGEYTIAAHSNSGAYCNPRDIRWSVTNSSIVSLEKVENSNKAIIKGLREGTTYVKVTLYNGIETGCTVSVKKAPTRQQLIDFIINQIGKTGANSQNYYGVGRNIDWCCYFLGYCIDRVYSNNNGEKNFAQIRMGFIDSDGDPKSYGSDAGDIARAAQKTDNHIPFHKYGDGYVPKKGDIFIMCKNDSFRTHVGFIENVEYDKDGKVTKYKTIEGNANSSDASAATVARFERTYNTKDGEYIDTHIYGFIDLSYYFTD